MTPGENDLAQTIGQLSITRARLLDQLQQSEIERMKTLEELEATRKVLTPTQRTKLGLEVDSE